MIAGLDPWLAMACVAIVFVGSAVQGTLGLGMGMIAAPVLTIVDRAFVPGAIVISVIPLSIAVAARERHAIDRRGVVLALVGRAPGVVLGSLAVAFLATRTLAVLVAVSVLFAVVVSARAVRFRTTPRNLVTAGLASGFTGTATGVGGPPMAITYQHADASTMRSTLAAFFTLGAIMSLVGLAVSGELGARQWELSLLVLPGVLAGVAASRLAAGRLRDDRVRVAVLVLCAVSALALLVEELA